MEEKALSVRKKLPTNVLQVIAVQVLMCVQLHINVAEQNLVQEM